MASKKFDTQISTADDQMTDNFFELKRDANKILHQTVVPLRSTPAGEKIVMIEENSNGKNQLRKVGDVRYNMN